MALRRRHGAWCLPERWLGPTKYDDVQDQDDEPYDASAGAVLPRVVVAAAGSDFTSNGRSGGERHQPELGEQGGDGE